MQEPHLVTLLRTTRFMHLQTMENYCEQIVMMGRAYDMMRDSVDTMEETCIPDFVATKVRLQPRPCFMI